MRSWQWLDRGGPHRGARGGVNNDNDGENELYLWLFLYMYRCICSRCLEPLWLMPFRHSAAFGGVVRPVGDERTRQRTYRFLSISRCQGCMQWLPRWGLLDDLPCVAPVWLA